DTDDTAVTVNNVAPQVTLTSTNWILTEGQSTNFVGSFVDPGTLDTHSIVWDFGDGSGPTPGALNENYTYVAADQYTVTLTITDDDGGVGIDSGLVTVLQQISPPTAAAGGPYNVNEGGSVLLNGGGSTDPNNLPLSYAWDWDNDGQFDDAVGAAATFSAAVLDDGVQSIALQVSNGIYTDTEGTAVTILNVAPQVTFDTISWQILAGETAAFTGDFTDPGRLDTHTIVWDFGDSGTANGSLTPSHLYANTGQYVVTLTVQDDDNGIGQATHQLQVVESFLQYLPIVANNYCSAVPIPADIILAIDTSSSMSKPATTGGTKLDAAKEAAAAFIDLLDFPHDQAGIVSFANSAILEHALSVNAGSLHNAIQTLVAAGITRMDKAVFQSRQELTGPRHNDSSSQIMILLTDGQPNGTTPEAVRAEANMAKAAGIVIYTIGLGSDIDTTLMRDIATSPDHYYEAPSAADLNDIYIEIATQIHCK
ncbi:MAG: VWA domain-containing protein, partial [Chloroflexi bacterium]|nr:VWA domain-containing protein [Chloroflexota bacterium]